MFNRKNLIILFFFAWVLLWIIFAIRGNKSGQYSDLGNCYTHPNYSDKIRYFLGNDFYEFISFSKRNLPPGATYDMPNLTKPDMPELQARYYLWPLRMTSQEPEFLLYFNSSYVPLNSFKLYKRFNNSYILARVGR